jgi:general stress protein YciG
MLEGMKKKKAPVPDEEISVREAGRRGGTALKAKYGSEHFRKLGAKGGKTTRERFGHEHFVEIGAKGGAARLKEEGVEYYAEIGAIGGAKSKALFDAKRAEEQE